jgi:putative molybdopterin biosynthesis protein
VNSLDREWMTVNQACRRLAVSRKRLYRLINEGHLPAYRIGRMIRLLAADIEAYRREQSGEKEEP